MLRSKDIIGLPVFTLAEGKELGKITEILVNPGRGAAAALAVENTSKIVTFSSIKSIGKDAVVIDSASQLMELSEHRSIERWKEIRIVDSKVITSTGRYMGQVGDFLLDMLTGKIISCVATDPEGERSVIPASRIVTFGKDALIVVDEEFEEALELEEEMETEQMEETLETAREEKKVEREEIKTVLEQLAEEIEKEPGEEVGKAAAEATPQQTPSSGESVPEAGESATGPPPEARKEEVLPSEAGTKETQITATKAEEPSAKEEPKEASPPKAQAQIPAESAKEVTEKTAPQQDDRGIKRPEEQVQELLNRRQHDFLLGKKVKRDLLADDGAIILKAGDTITEDVLGKSKRANKYLELGFYV